MSRLRVWDEPLPEPILVLERVLKAAGTSIIQAAFENSFFIDPDAVRAKTPYFPDRARLSREYYPGCVRGGEGLWQGRRVRLGDNARAQMAWAGYTKRSISRASGYGVRHIWGHPWDPDAFTAGWNLCYMPFWLGMLTEEQHPHELLRRAIQQVSYDLYFRQELVCPPPSYVVDPGLSLGEHLGSQEILILGRAGTSTGPSKIPGEVNPVERIKGIRRLSNQSWSNLLKAVLSLQDLPHEPFGTSNVQSSSKSVVRRMRKATGLSLEELTKILESFKGVT